MFPDLVDKKKNLMYNKSNLIDDILVTNVLIGKTVKAVTAPATVKGDSILYHCAMHGKVNVG